jgi:hypothetical protein
MALALVLATKSAEAVKGVGVARAARKIANQPFLQL